MAIKKDSSRFTDRNKIRKMHGEGYSLQQIADTTSITFEHVEYVIEKWDADLEKSKDKARLAEQEAAIEAKVKMQPVNPQPDINAEERARIRESARRELMEEMAAEQKDGEAEVTDETPPEETAPAESEKSTRRRRKKVDEAA